MEKRSDPKKIQDGDILSELQHYTVIDICDDAIRIRNERGEKFTISNNIVKNGIYTANQYTSTETLSRTEVIEQFITHTGVAMTVNFNKQKKEADVKKELYDMYAKKGGKIISFAAHKKNCNTLTKTIFTGEERTMLGRHYGHIDERGRIQFIDMKQPIKYTETKEGYQYDTRQRLVDPRTINWLIVKNVKYVVK